MENKVSQNRSASESANSSGMYDEIIPGKYIKFRNLKNVVINRCKLQGHKMRKNNDNYQLRSNGHQRETNKQTLKNNYVIVQVALWFED